jgi:hypothetical protein
LIEISTIIDLLRTQPPQTVMLMALGISFIQFMTFIAISNVENDVDKSQNVFYIILSLIFSTIAITNAGVPLLIDVMRGFIS